MSSRPSLLTALIPVFFLVVFLSINVIGVFGDEALAGSNQFILLLAGALAAFLAYREGCSWKRILEGIESSISSTAGAIIILLLIGALAGSWMLSGIVPAMIYYGLEILNPKIFLPATALICALVSVSTGSSWSTTATVGIALIGIGKALNFNEALVAGSVISGAYFGDKISPLSDTTNLAPAMAGTDLFTHIRYMLYTTLPSFMIALVVFALAGYNAGSVSSLSEINQLQNELASVFNINPWLFLVPALVIFMIVKKIPALPAILAGTLLGAVFAFIFQIKLIEAISGPLSAASGYQTIMNALTVSASYPVENPFLEALLQTGGMAGMLGTVWLIITAMVFGGAMEAGGFLARISEALLQLAHNTASLIATTAGTCITLNLTASDQYLAIVVPGKMYAETYRQRNLAPENLSRTLEDSGTVTSVLVPYNTCGAYQSTVLGVDTLAYLPFAVFNYLSPFFTILYAATGFKIRSLAEAGKTAKPGDD